MRPKYRRKMTTDIPLKREVKILLDHYKRVHNGISLDATSATWLVTNAAWDDLCWEFNILQKDTDLIREKKPMLFGIPVRVTYGDPDDVPRIQLMMEPDLYDPVAFHLGDIKELFEPVPKYRANVETGDVRPNPYGDTPIKTKTVSDTRQVFEEALEEKRRKLDRT